MNQYCEICGKLQETIQVNSYNEIVTNEICVDCYKASLEKSLLEKIFSFFCVFFN